MDKEREMKKTLYLFLVLGLLSLGACTSFGSWQKTVPADAAPTSPVPTTNLSPTPTLEPTPEPALEPAPEPTLEQHARRLEIKLEADQKIAMLQDGKIESCCRFVPGAALIIKADEEIAGLSLVWYDHPQPWILEVDGESLSCGEQGFLHEYVALPHTAKELTIRFPETESIRLSEICAFSPGRVPDDVQVWQNPCKQADILLIPTHADDEFVFFGGIIPLYAAERGLDVQLIYMISHYGSMRIRCHELLDALWYAGIRHYPIVNSAPDREIYSVKEAENLYGENAFIDFQVEQIRRFRPLVVVTHDENGEYRQGNHMFTALSLDGQSFLLPTRAIRGKARKSGVCGIRRKPICIFTARRATGLY